MDEPRGDERGQLILIAGIGIAVALVLNSLVFTQYLATKPTADGSDAIAYEHTVEDGVRGLVSEANYREYESSVDTVVREGVTGNFSTSLTKQYGAYGTLVNASVRDIETGTSIHQDDARRFTNAAGGGNWTPIGDANGVRGFRLKITNASEASVDRPLRVNVSIAGNETTPVEIYNDGTDIVLNDTTDEDDVSDSFFVPATINFSNGSVNGRETGQLTFYDGPNVTDVTITNGDRAVGKYVAVANEAQSDVKSDGNYSGTPDRSPYTVDAVYAATLHATYVGPDVTYETGLRVSPDAFGAGPNGLTPEYGVFRVPRSLVFVNAATGNLSTIDPETLNITDYGVSDVESIGPMEYDFDDDGRPEIPYVNASNRLKLIDQTGETQVLTGSDAMGDGALVGAGRWRGNLSLFYANKTDNKNIYRVSIGTEPTPVTEQPHGSSTVGSSSVIGVGDFNRDGDPDLVYLGTSQEVKYIDNGQTISTDKNANSGSANRQYGVGAPRLFNTSDATYVPFVTGNQHKGLLKANGQYARKFSDSAWEAKNSPLTGIDLVGDPRLDVVYIGNDDSQILYVTLDGKNGQVAGGVKADPAVGVA